MPVLGFSTIKTKIKSNFKAAARTCRKQVCMFRFALQDCNNSTKERIVFVKPAK